MAKDTSKAVDEGPARFREADALLQQIVREKYNPSVKTFAEIVSWLKRHCGTLPPDLVQ